MKKATAIGLAALAAGLVAALVVPLVVPVTSSGTESERDVAGDQATFVDIESVSVHYESLPYSGDGVEQPLFVLLHGFGASTYSWRDVLDDFAELGDVVAYDRPAFGLTERPTSWEGASPYGVDAQMDLVQGVIEEFADEGQPVVLVGHSAGGTLAAEFALRKPDQVSGLILVAPAILTSGGGPSWLSFLYDIPQIDRIGPLLVGGIATSGEDLLERSWHDPSKLTAEIREAYRAPLRIEGWEAAFWEFQKAPRTFTVTANPAGISVPTSIITGDDDRVVATEDSLALAELIPGATLSVIPNSGHLPQEETPSEFMEAVARALSPDSLDLRARPVVTPVVTEVPGALGEVAETLVDCSVEPCVALTFDDGPSSVVTQLLETLDRFEAEATFFVVGRQVRAWPGVISAITDAGHEIGNHSMNHVRLSRVSESTRSAEIEGVDELVWAELGYYPTFIRPPYGDIPRSGILDPHQRPVVMWSVDAYDWKRRTPERIASEVLDQVKPGDIILMHALSTRSAEALPLVLEGLAEKSLRVVSVSTLIGSEATLPSPLKRVPFECPVEPSPMLEQWCPVVKSPDETP